MNQRRAGSSASWVWFAALALYGTVRWATLLPRSDQNRLFLALGVAVACAAAVRLLPGGAGTRWRWAIACVALSGLLVALAVAGYPLGWVLALHLGRLGTRVGMGISRLSGVLVPYRGADRSITGVIVLGAALLLLCAGLTFGTVRGTPGTGRLGLAAMPLLALAVVPSAIGAPQVAYLHGLLGFGLVALLVFSPRLAPGRGGGATVLLAGVAIAGALGANALVGNHVWIQAARGTRVVVGDGVGPSDVFDWQQTYGDQRWPHSGATVLTVRARHAAYWKAEDLDRFNGVAWTPGTAGDPGLAGVSRAHLAAYSERLTVNVDQLSTNLVIAAGYAGTPTVAGASRGADPGTWRTPDTLGFGAVYHVPAYVPTPPATQLARAGRTYPAALSSFRTVGPLPGAYAGVEALARRLAAGTDSPYGYVEAVLDDLRRGYVYTLTPPPGGRYPLAAFLLEKRRGYCQQFAGAMALLLRLGGVPARVAVGFSSGSHVVGTDTYRVTDRDAHAWVEVWFPRFGWVTFDPTPGKAVGSGALAGTTPADGGSTPSGAAAGNRAATLARSARERRARERRQTASAAHGRRSARWPGKILLGILGALALAFAVLAIRGRRRRPSTAELTEEVSRAFARCGRPLSADLTLATLAGRMRDSPSAAGYISALAASRYAREPREPTAQGRAALRRWLASGSGLGGWLRATRALPPRRLPSPPGSRSPRRLPSPPGSRSSRSAP
jgi:transglutaminase-like putative cysteine protease